MDIKKYKYEWRKLCDNAYVVGKKKIVYFRGMVRGKRIIKRATLQGALAIDARGRATKELKQAATAWMLGRYNEEILGEKDTQLKTPTMRELAKAYLEASRDERIKNGRPCQRTTENVLKNFAQLIEGCGLEWSDKITALTTEKIDMFIISKIKEGLKPPTAWTYATSAQSMMARWTEVHYRRRGIKRHEISMPVFKKQKGERYERPKKETLEKVMEWYRGLWNERDKRKWLAATMMLQFAMRNGDVRRMDESFFIEEPDGKVTLQYTPTKTQNTSGRTVKALVHEEIWKKIKMAAKEIEDFEKSRGGKRALAEILEEDLEEEGQELEPGKKRMIPGAVEIFHRLNENLRKAVPEFANTTKASYELRKICVDHIYQHFGAEAASAISGDDIRTVTRYYADPKQATREAVMIETLV